MNTPAQPDSLSASKKREIFFKILFGQEAEGFVCISYMDMKDGKKRWEDVLFKYPDELPNMLHNIEQRYKTANTYYCPQLLASKERPPGAKSARVKENVKACTAAWADLDTCDPSLMLVKPTIAVMSSGNRYQALWVFEHPIFPAEAEQVSKNIAYHHVSDGADSGGWDLTQALRVPCTYNFKYTPPQEVKILSIGRNKYRTTDFAVYKESRINKAEHDPMPELLPTEQPTDIMQRYRRSLNPIVFSIFSVTPTATSEEGGWSKILWQLIMLCFEAGMGREEVFAVASEAACNKYKRDRKHPKLLWDEICRAYISSVEKLNVLVPETEKQPGLITEDELASIDGYETFIERYVRWASSLGDAAKQYHHAGAFMILSSLLAGSIRLPTSFGTIMPNLWFLLLADTCQPLSSKVLTPTGWTTMGEVQIGSYVIGRNGRPTQVLAASNVMEDECYKVTFIDGGTVECTEDHLWTVKASYERTMSLSKVRELHSKTSGKPVVPTLSAPVEFVGSSSLPIDPYLLGIWLGEGSSTNTYVSFASGEDGLVELIREVLPKDLRLVNYTPEDGRWKSWTWHIKSSLPGQRGPAPYNSVREGLRGLGLLCTGSHERFIPEQYKFASVADRIALLQGILDGEGHVQKGGNVKMDSTSKHLIDDTIDVIRSLGGIARYNGGRLTPLGNHNFWTLTFTPPEGLVPFRLKRKADKVRSSSWKYRGIKSIEPIGRKQVRCIKVAAPDGLYITDDWTVTHNTLTRKSTAMDVAMDIVDEVDDNILLATDGSLEGLMQSLEIRPGKPSMFLRDEFSGLIEAMSRKDYLAGMPEALTKLYDGKTMKRVLKRETVTVREPCLLIFGGGIKTRVQSLLTLDHVASGFVPRFLFVTAESDVSKLKPLGPPTEQSLEERSTLIDELRETRDMYVFNQDVVVKGKIVGVSDIRAYAVLTEDAWDRYNRLETTLLYAGVNSDQPDVMTPVYDRLSKSILKASVLIAASKGELEDDTLRVTLQDLLVAIKYGATWRDYANEIINGIGRSANEIMLQRILKSIRRNPGVSRAKLMQWYHLEARHAEILFGTMEQRGLILATRMGRTWCYEAVGRMKIHDPESNRNS